MTKGMRLRRWNTPTPGRASSASRWEKSSTLPGAVRDCGVFISSGRSLQTARELGEQLFRSRRPYADPDSLVWAHSMLGLPLFWLGEFAGCPQALGTGDHLYDSAASPATALLWRARPEMIVSRMRCNAVALGVSGSGSEGDATRRSLGPGILSSLLLGVRSDFAAWLSSCSSAKWRVVQEHAEEAHAAQQNKAFRTGWLGNCPAEVGTGTAGQEEAGIARCVRGWTPSTGAELEQVVILAQLAEAYGKMGQEEEGFLCWLKRSSG